ncbi:MAG: hypothetical protein ABH871_01680 [Pseudomonadota bacterium]
MLATQSLLATQGLLAAFPATIIAATGACTNGVAAPSSMTGWGSCVGSFTYGGSKCGNYPTTPALWRSRASLSANASSSALPAKLAVAAGLSAATLAWPASALAEPRMMRSADADIDAKVLSANPELVPYVLLASLAVFAGVVGVSRVVNWVKKSGSRWVAQSHASVVANATAAARKSSPCDHAARVEGTGLKGLDLEFPAPVGSSRGASSGPAD